MLIVVAAACCACVLYVSQAPADSSQPGPRLVALTQVCQGPRAQFTWPLSLGMLRGLPLHLAGSPERRTTLLSFCKGNSAFTEVTLRSCAFSRC